MLNSVKWGSIVYMAKSMGTKKRKNKNDKQNK